MSHWLTSDAHTYLCFPRKPILSSGQGNISHESSNFQNSEHAEELLKKLVEVNILQVICWKYDVILLMTFKFIILSIFPYDTPKYRYL